MPRGSRRSSGGFGGGFGGFGGGSRAPAAPRRAASPVGGGAPRPAAAPVPAHAPPGGFAPAHYGGYRAPGFGTMVGMGMGVGLGSAAGHALGGMLFGRGSPAETRAQIEEAQAAPRDQCGVELSMFNKCIEKKDTEACAQYYNDVMQCKRVAEGYPPYAATPAPQQGGMVPQAQMGSAENSNMAIQSGDKFY